MTSIASPTAQPDSRKEGIQPFPMIRRVWSESKWFRVALVVALIYTVVRLLMQSILLMGAISPDQSEANLALPDDLRIYLEASANLRDQNELYPTLPLERMEFYQYAPAFALAFTPFTWLPTGLTVILHTLLHIVFYVLLYTTWGRIFKRLNMERGLLMLAITLPVWLIFAPFWSDLGYLNVYILMALMASLLIEAVLSENLLTSALLAAIILQIKPQWAFMLAVPLLIGQREHFIKLLFSTIALYLIFMGSTILLVGQDYGWIQHAKYYQLLLGIGGNYPWRLPDAPFLGYNHSIAQTVIYLFGNPVESFRLATVVKAVIMLPLVLAALRAIFRPVKLGKDEQIDGYTALNWAFALYTAAFIWLDVVWELSLGIAVFTYLLATMNKSPIRWLMIALFMVYALVDAIQVISYIVFGDAIITPGPYILTDPSIYLPLTIMVAVLFYTILTRRLWATRS